MSETTAILSAFDSVTSIDLATGEKRWEDTGLPDTVYAVSVSTDETLVIASDFYGTTRLLDFDDRAARSAPHWPTGRWPPPSGGPRRVVRGNFSAFLPGGHVALIVDWDTGIVRLVDVDSRTEVSPPFTAVSGLSLWSISPDGHVAIVGGANGATRLYDLQAGAPIGDPFPSRSTITFGMLHPRRPVHDRRSTPPTRCGTSTPHRGGRRPAPSPGGT